MSEPMYDQAYFDMNTGNRITNIVSHGADGELLLTYTFAKFVPGYHAGPEDDAKPASGAVKHAGAVVEHGVARIRELVLDGTIKAK
jgi:hypothetical protein